jgi:hypothetical protein
MRSGVHATIDRQIHAGEAPIRCPHCRDLKFSRMRVRRPVPQRSGTVIQATCSCYSKMNDLIYPFENAAKTAATERSPQRP